MTTVETPMTGSAEAVRAPVLPSWNRSHRAQGDDRRDEDQRDDEADDEDDVDAGCQSAAEAPVAGGKGQAEDHDDVGDALDEDRADGPRRRGAVVRLEQIRAVKVSQLGRHEAVHEPRQIEDLERVEEPDARPHLGEDEAPAERANRERQVVGDEGKRKVPDVRPEDQLPGRGEVDAEGVEGQHQQDDREDDRSDRPPVEDAPGEADLALGDLLVGRGIEELARLVERTAFVGMRAGVRMTRRPPSVIGHSSSFSFGGSSAGLGR